MNHEQDLLNLLLKKYEASRAYTEDHPARRRIMLDVSRGRFGDFPAYDFEDYPQKILIHSIVDELKRAGLVEYTWLKGDEGNILHRIWLNPDHLASAYQRASRLSPRDQAEQIGALLDEAEKAWARADQQAYAWIGKVLLDLRQVLEKRKRLTAPWPLDPDQAAGLVKTLAYLLTQDPQTLQTGIFERVFSLKVFGDSKTFERHIRSRLISLIHRYYLPELYAETENHLNELDLSDDELLELIGLVRAPEIFEFSGPLLARRGGNQADYAFNRQVSTLSATELDDLGFIIPDAITRILFVENRTNFYALSQKHFLEGDPWADTLIIYHGGCFSPAKARFIELLRLATERRRQGGANGRTDGISVCHWGDIDLGGFMIFCRLRDRFFPDLQPWRMGCADLGERLAQAQPMSDAYMKMMRQAMADSRFAIFRDVMALALENGVRLEQEAFLVD